MTLDEARAGIGRWVVAKSDEGEDVFGVITSAKEPFVYVRFEPNQNFSHPTLPEWIEFPVVIT